MLQQAQEAAASGGIERLLQITGNIAALDQGILAKIDFDYTLDKYSHLLNNDPRLMRTDEAAEAIRQQQQKAAADAQAADNAQKLAQAGQTMSETDVGGGKSALQQMGIGQ
jgi:hypothetical protein